MYTDSMSLRMHICTLLAAAMFVSCSPAQNEQSNKNASTEYEIPIEQEIFLKDCLSQNESQYLVFFHSETCSHCKEIRGDVLSFCEANLTKIYFLDIKKPTNEIQTCPKEEIVIGVNNSTFFISISNITTITCGCNIIIIGINYTTFTHLVYFFKSW